MSPGEHPDNPPTRPAPRRLEVTMSSEDEVWIRGDKAGLEYLADWCHRIIGKSDPSGHIHFQWQMNNLLEGSLAIRLEFFDDDEDFES